VFLVQCSFLKFSWIHFLDFFYLINSFMYRMFKGVIVDDQPFEDGGNRLLFGGDRRRRRIHWTRRCRHLRAAAAAATGATVVPVGGGGATVVVVATRPFPTMSATVSTSVVIITAACRRWNVLSIATCSHSWIAAALVLDASTIDFLIDFGYI
jgi:hypothetical protein